MSWELIVKEKFSSAHFLENYKGKCEHMHGHTFRIEAYFRVEQLDESGIGIDFTELKAYLRSILPDHQVLNEVFDFSPSAENLSKYLYYKIKEKYNVTKVVIWESENAGAVYSQD
ncbi:MAG: 6-carboxytetrahydropterin synthase [Candidatus Aminicenantes bacterium]|nr:6-carboxytetrahydropterin synthase [Candidatus Aminicenantes bacterium]